jgi:hypothetical protein
MQSVRFFTPEVSESITVARVVCISLMIFVHVWPGATQILDAPTDPVIHFVYLLIIDEFARSSVPLLSIVSGVLLIRTFQKRPQYLSMIRSKARTLLVPMIIWSSIAVALRTGYGLAMADPEALSGTALDWANKLFAVTAEPANLPLAFLRDLFVCCVMTMASLFITRQNRAILLVILALWAIVETGMAGILVLRPQIAVFFTFGIALACYPPESVRLNGAFVLGLYALDCFLRHGPAADYLTNHAALLISTLHRASVSFLMWYAVVTLVRNRPQISQMLRRVESRIFLVFCSHSITITVMSFAFSILGLQVTDKVYPLVFFLQLAVIYLVAEMFYRLMKSTFPQILNIMIGRRSDRKVHP